MKFSRKPVGDQIEQIHQEAEERDAMRRAKEEGAPYLKEETIPTRETLSTIPEESAREAGVAVVAKKDENVTLIAKSANNPKTKEVIEALKKEGLSVNLFLTTKSKLERAWAKYSPAQGGQKRKSVSDKVELEESTIQEVRETIKNIGDATNFFKKTGPDTPTSTLLGYILGTTLALRASDVHIERKAKDESLMRMRIDGELRDIAPLAKRSSHLLVNRIKLLAGLKLNIRDSAQDGRFTIESPSGPIEVRSSVVPSEYGEAVVMRVLDPAMIGLELSDLGLREDDEAMLEKELKKPNGMILVTGPTGSGKTTTLYAFLKKLHSPKIKIITIEDPIEYHIEGIEQTQTDEENNYTFASGLKSILRQDPDVILIGEIRDSETAGTSIDAALTGHLVLSTLHTNKAAGAIPRLIDLDVRPSTIGPAVTIIIAQRLVKRLCEKCKKKVELDDTAKKNIEKFQKGLPKRVSRESMKKELYEPVGCDECDGGFIGRIAIMEILQADDKMESLIKKEATEGEIEKHVIVEQGMVLMQHDGILKALQGLTTLDEVERVTGPIEW